MALCAEEDGLEGQLCVAPGARRGNPFLRETEVKMRYQIMAELRAMYADLQSAPIPDHLLQLVRAFEMRQETSQHDA
jgi:hypothetical protein